MVRLPRGEGLAEPGERGRREVPVVERDRRRRRSGRRSLIVAGHSLLPRDFSLSLLGSPDTLSTHDGTVEMSLMCRRCAKKREREKCVEFGKTMDAFFFLLNSDDDVVAERETVKKVRSHITFFSSKEKKEKALAVRAFPLLSLRA